MKRNYKKILISIFILVTGVILTIGCSGNKENSENTNNAPIIKSKIYKVRMQNLPLTESMVGTVISKNQANVSSKVMGTIQDIYVKEGESVKAGQRLAKVDSRDLIPNVVKANAGIKEVESGLSELNKSKEELAAAQQAAQANYDYASTSLHRMQNLYDRQAISKDMLDETIRQYKLAESNLATVVAKQGGLEDKRNQLLAKQNQVKADQQLANVYLGYASINSPISGIVIKKFMDKGSMATPGQPIFQIETPDYQFEVAVKESLFSQVKVGQKVEVKLDTLSQPIEGSIVEIVSSADPASRTFTIKISLPKIEGVRSGQFGKALFTFGDTQKLVIPKSALVDRGALEGVYALDSSNMSRFRLVKTGDEYGDMIEITTGLEPNDRILISDLDKIQEGNKVEVIE